MNRQKISTGIQSIALLWLLNSPGTVAMDMPSSGNGAWGPVIQMPAIPVSAANLPDGRILTWSAHNLATYGPYGQDKAETWTAIFNPDSNQTDLTLVDTIQHDMFCPGASMLADGRVLVNGGSSAARTSIFDSESNSWSQDAVMNIPRAYNASTLLADGSVLTLGGSWAENVGCLAPEQNCPDKTAEVWSEGNGWTVLPGIPADALRTDDVDGLFRSDNHMWLFTMSGGQVLHAGPSKDMHLLDTGNNGSYTHVGNRADDDDAMNGNAIMYDVGKILTLGGAPDYEKDNATDSAFVIEINNGNVTSRRVADMAYQRAYHNSVVLPNGEVVVIGGQPYPVPFSDTDSVYATEIWNPVTETFRSAASMAVPRNYHSIALLLLDGRVIAGGGGLCGPGCSTNHPDMEIYTPPYLLDNNGNLLSRPTISNAPAEATYGQQFAISTDSSIASFVLIRMAVATHSVNNAQRRIPLSFTNSSGFNYIAQIPTDSGIVTPGNYMLFALDSSGTPSEATVINIQQQDDTTYPTVSVDSPAADLPLAANASFDIEGTAWDDLTGVERVLVRVQRFNPSRYWNGNNWQTSADAFQQATLTDNDWSLDSVDLSVAGNYQINLLVRDFAGNEAPFNQNPIINFSITEPDTTFPTATITNPLSNSAITANAAFEIQGTATDDSSGIERVRVQIIRTDPNPSEFWNGSNWQTSVSQTWQLATLNNSNWTLNNVDLSATGSYQIRLSVRDNAGNQAPSIQNPITHFSINEPDTTFPTATITNPLSNSAITANAAFEIQGTATDDSSGIERVRVQIIRTDPNPSEFWNGSNWQTSVSQTWQLATLNNSNWTLNNVDLSATGSYQIRLSVRDNAGNQAPSIQNPITHFSINEPDTTFPTATITNPLSNSAITANAAFEIQGTATDDSSGIERVRVQIIRTGPGPSEFWNGSNWQTSVSQTWQLATLNNSNWTLNNVDLSATGSYQIRLSVRDNAGNQAPSIQNPITHFSINEPDTTFPTATITNPVSNSAITANAAFEIQGTATDDSSGIERVRVQIIRTGPGPSEFWNGSNWQTSVSQTWQLATLNNSNWTLDNVDLSATGSYQIRLSVRDNAGNQAPAIQNPITHFSIGQGS